MSLAQPPAPGLASGDAGAQRLSVWFSITGLVLLATVLAAAFVQVRQYSLLDLSVRQQDDYLAFNLYQIETEYLRLRAQLRQEVDAPGSPALQLRYDIFVSRVALMHGERAQRLLAYGEDAAAVMQRLDNLIQRADLYLGTDPRGTLSAQAARVLLAELEALDAPVRQLMIDASHRVASRVTERQSQVRQHNRIGLGLTGFLLAAVLVFAGIALRQMRAIEQRRGRQAQLVEQLREARIEAEAANAAKSEFLADMSHELRTPLHGLLGMLSLVRESPRDPRAVEWLGAADDSAQHLQRLIDDIIDLSKLEAGSLALSPTPLLLAGLLREVQALLLPQACAKGLSLQCELDPALPMRVALDATRSRQVLYNLLANSIKFSDSGAIVLRCQRRVDSTGDGDGDGAGDGPAMLVFEVADTGIGMDRDTVTGLFRRFRRASDPRALREDGSGLGLAISRKLARLMGGDLTVRSTPGAGSVFCFSCPLLPVSEATRAATPARTLAQEARPLQVLVAEDHPVNQLYMRALLARLGHHATLVGNGLQVLQALQARLEQPALPPFDLVLMDVHMPLMDGVEATAALRRLPPPVGSVCVVALTADVYGETRDRCLAAGMDDVATKPLGNLALRALLDRRFGNPLAAPDAPGLPALAAPADRLPPSPWHDPMHHPSHDAPDDAPHDALHDSPQDPVASLSLIDTATLLSVRDLMGPDSLPSLYNGFFSQAEDAARRMRDALRHADAEALRRCAHNVKGAALNLGLPALAQAAALLNQEAGNLAGPQLALAVQRYEEITQATRTLCQGEGWLR